MADGRKLAPRPKLFPGKDVKNSQVNLIISTFLGSKSSSHSSKALTLPYLIQYCEEHKIYYQLTAIPGKGYAMAQVKLTENCIETIRP